MSNSRSDAERVEKINVIVISISILSESDLTFSFDTLLELARGREEVGASTYWTRRHLEQT